MGGYNPMAAVLRGQAGPRLPQTAGPMQGPRGGVMGQTSYMPPQPGVEIAQGISDLVNTFAQNKQQQQAKAMQEVQQGIQMAALGLPVDKVALAKKLKKSGMGEILDFENPMQATPQQQQPTQMQGAQMGQPQPMPSMQGGMAPGPMPGGLEAPPQMAPQMPRPQGPPMQVPGGQVPGMGPGQAPQRQGMLSRIGERLGLTSGPVNRDSAGVQAMGMMTDSARAGYQQQQMASQQEAMLKQQDAMLKSRVMGLSLVTLGVDPNTGRSVSPQDSAKARQMLAEHAGKFDAEDISMVISRAEQMLGRNLSPEEKEGFFSSWMFSKLGFDKVSTIAENMAKTLMTEAGMDASSAYSSAFRMARGQGVPDMPKFNAKSTERYLKASMDLREQYPTATPDVWRRVDPLIWTGDIASAAKLLGGALPTKANIGENREQRKEGREAEQLNLSRQGLAVSQYNAQTARAQLGETQKSNEYRQKMGQIGVFLDTLKAGNVTPSPEQLKNVWGLMQSVMPGFFDIDPGMKEGWFSDTPGIKPLPGASGVSQGRPESPSSTEFLDWMRKDFAPAFNNVMGQANMSTGRVVGGAPTVPNMPPVDDAAEARASIQRLQRMGITPPPQLLKRAQGGR
jgi:hypothetical protein